MKLFQIEEPDGAPESAEGPGAAVGIDIDPAGGAVAIAVGGNAEILPAADGTRRAALSPLTDAAGLFDAAALAKLFAGLRGQAEKQLVRPVTHAVIAAAPLAEPQRRAIVAAATAAGIEVLRILARADAAALAQSASSEEAAVLGAAIAAEDLAPTPA